MWAEEEGFHKVPEEAGGMGGLQAAEGFFKLREVK
jgi:hypothetical protein